MSGNKNSLITNVATVKELLVFFWRSKIWWLTPVVLALVLLSAIVVLTESSALAPFISPTPRTPTTRESWRQLSSSWMLGTPPGALPRQRARSSDSRGPSRE